ncbi:MAG: SUMF1/EgtB/PvdO family nonheme iron enzyme [Pseudomonadota bacterium]
MIRLSSALAFVLVGCSPSTPSASSVSEADAKIGCGVPEEARGAFVSIPDGEFVKSADPKQPEEGRPQRLAVEGFEIQTHEVTNDQFARFVAETGYVTDAERERVGAGSAIFTPRPQPGSWLDVWRLDPDANWRAPTGAGSSITDLGDHPVVHVSLRDAATYAEWAGGRLPSEIEWEYAAALNQPDPSDPESGAYTADRTPIANTWQGLFPIENTAADGFDATAPVGCYAAGGADLFDMIGNVWEWTTTPYANGQATLKGGSHLCSDNFCARYRIAARQGQDIDFSTNHIGFRIVKDPPNADD